MTPDAQVLRFPSGAGGMGEEEYGRFSRELSPDELAGCFFFSDDDRRRIASRRRETNRLGFAVQLGTVRYLGRFLEDPAEVPGSVLAWTGREIGITPGMSLTGYADGEARWEHQAEIRRVYGYTPFGDDGVEDELSLWLRARAWMSAESHRVLFARAAEHLIARRILLPGYTTLWRLVGNAREHADLRGFAMLADTPTQGFDSRFHARVREDPEVGAVQAQADHRLKAGARQAARRQGRDGEAHAPAHSRAGSLARPRPARALQLLRGARQQRGATRLSQRDHPALAEVASAA